jgi:hypothetical protein
MNSQLWSHSFWSPSNVFISARGPWDDQQRHRKAPPTDKWMVPVAGGSYLIIYEFIYIYDSIYVHFNIDLYSYILIQDWIWICPKLGKFKGIHRHFSVEHDFINRHILGIRQPQLMASAAIKTGILVGLRGHISKKQLHTFKIPSSKLT